MKISTKLSSGFSLLIVFSVGLGGVAIYQMDQVQAKTETMVHNNLQTLKLAADIEYLGEKGFSCNQKDMAVNLFFMPSPESLESLENEVTHV